MTGGALTCPSCAGAFGADERFCPDCGMPLVATTEAAGEVSETHARARKIDPSFAEGELVRVAGARHQAEAEMIQGLLLEEGVPSLLRRSAGFDVPDFLAAGPRDVMVAAGGYEVAREVLLETGLAQTPPPPSADAPSDASRALRLAAAVAGASVVASLVAWALVELAG